MTAFVDSVRSKLSVTSTDEAGRLRDFFSLKGPFVLNTAAFSRDSYYLMGLLRINGREVESHPLMLDLMAVMLPACASFTVLSASQMSLGTCLLHNWTARCTGTVQFHSWPRTEVNGALFAISVPEVHYPHLHIQ